MSEILTPPLLLACKRSHLRTPFPYAYLITVFNIPQTLILAYFTLPNNMLHIAEGLRAAFNLLFF